MYIDSQLDQKIIGKTIGNVPIMMVNIGSKKDMQQFKKSVILVIAR